jgi:hypothetical protein
LLKAAGFGVIENTEPGVTRTERLLHALCQRTFLRIWSYANPFNSDGKEFCDVVAIFGNHVFIFFDRESRRLDGELADLDVSWKRWRKETIDKQIRTANGAERYLRRGGKLYTSIKRDAEIPISLPENAIIHKIIVAHGASEACKNHSPMNATGSLGMVYSGRLRGIDEPFIVELLSADRVHVLDSFNLEIILTELDTFYDFSSFIEEKERAILALDYLSYCGEEDLLAHYLGNYNEAENKYSIGSKAMEIFLAYTLVKASGWIFRIVKPIVEGD